MEISRKPSRNGLVLGWREIASRLEAQIAPQGTLLSFAIALRMLSPSGGGTYVDAPVIFCHSRAVALDAAGAVVTRELLDVTSNACAVRAGNGEAAAARLAQGVADAVAEHLVLSAGLTGEARQKNVENTAVLFAARQGFGRFDSFGNVDRGDWASTIERLFGLSSKSNAEEI